MRRDQRRVVLQRVHGHQLHAPFLARRARHLRRIGFLGRQSDRNAKSHVWKGIRRSVGRPRDGRVRLAGSRDGCGFRLCTFDLLYQEMF